MDHPHHHPVLLLRLRREQLGRLRQLGRKLRLRRRLRLWLRMQQRLQLRLQLQLQLWLQRQLLLSIPAGRDALRPAPPSPQWDRQSLTMAAISLWMSSGVRGRPPAAQSTRTQPWAAPISRALSRQRRR